MITWLEDPTKYAYLRMVRYDMTFRFPEKRMAKEKAASGGRLVGYERGKRLSPGFFEFDIYYLAPHDRDMQPDGVYAGPQGFGGGMPSEAVNPRELVVTNPYPTPEATPVEPRHVTANGKTRECRFTSKEDADRWIAMYAAASNLKPLPPLQREFDRYKRLGDAYPFGTGRRFR